MDETFEVTPGDPTCERCGKWRSEHHGRGKDLCLDDPASPLFRRCSEDMPRVGVAPHPDVPLGTYRHHKGGEYEVIGGALLASGDEDVVLVLYRPFDPVLYAPRTLLEMVGRYDRRYCAARTVADFIGLIPDGRRRFERIGKGA